MNVSCKDGTGWWMEDIPLNEQILPLCAQLASLIIGLPIHSHVILNLSYRQKILGIRKYQMAIVGASIIDLLLSIDHIVFEMNRTRRLFFTTSIRRSIVFLWQALSFLTYLLAALTTIYWKTATVRHKTVDNIIAAILSLITAVLIGYCFVNEVFPDRMPWNRAVGLLMTEFCQLGSLFLFCGVFAYYYVKMKKVDTRLCTSYTRRIHSRISNILLFETIYHSFVLVPNFFRYLIHYLFSGCFTPERSDHIAWWFAFQIYWTCSGLAPLVRGCLTAYAFNTLLSHQITKPGTLETKGSMV